jgi:hypothetical protein
MVSMPSQGGQVVRIGGTARRLWIARPGPRRSRSRSGIPGGPAAGPPSTWAPAAPRRNTRARYRVTLTRSWTRMVALSRRRRTFSQAISAWPVRSVGRSPVPARPALLSAPRAKLYAMLKGLRDELVASRRTAGRVVGWPAALKAHEGRTLGAAGAAADRSTPADRYRAQLSSIPAFIECIPPGYRPRSFALSR